MSKKIEIPKFTKIKGLLAEYEMKPKDLADIIGCGKSAINYKLNGKTKWGWDEMLMIKKHFKLNNDDFVEIFYLQ